MKRTILLLAVLAACGNKAKGSESPTPEPPDAAATPVEPTPEPDAGPSEPPPPDPEEVKAALLAAEVQAYEAAAPVFDAACSKCHETGGKSANKKKLDHFDMTTYPFGGHHTATITTTLRHVLGIDGAKPSMPADQKGSVAGEGLDLIAAWATAYDAAEEGGAHEGQPGYTPAE